MYQISNIPGQSGHLHVWHANNRTSYGKFSLIRELLDKGGARNSVSPVTPKYIFKIVMPEKYSYPPTY